MTDVYELRSKRIPFSQVKRAKSKHVNGRYIAYMKLLYTALIVARLISSAASASAQTQLVIEGLPLLTVPIFQGNSACTRWWPNVCKYWPGEQDGKIGSPVLNGFDATFAWIDANYPWRDGWEGFTYPPPNNNDYFRLYGKQLLSRNDNLYNQGSPSPWMNVKYQFSGEEIWYGVVQKPFVNEVYVTARGQYWCPAGANLNSVTPLECVKNIWSLPAESPSRGGACLIGDPVDPVYGVRYEQFTDYQSASGLALTRYYSSNNSEQRFGHNQISVWPMNLPASGSPSPPRYITSIYYEADYGRTLYLAHKVISNSSLISKPSITVMLGDKQFSYQQSTNASGNVSWAGDTRLALQTSTSAAGTRITVSDVDASMRRQFDDRGRLLEERSADGTRVVRYTYQSAQISRYPSDAPDCAAPATSSTQLALKCMSDQTGRVIAMQADANGLLTQASLPDGQTVRYQNNNQGLIERVTYGDQSGQLLHYGELGLATPISTTAPTRRIDLQQLTGLSDVAADGRVSRLTQFSYDGQGRSTITELAGGVERYAFGYSTSAGEQTIVTDPLGSQSTLKFIQGSYTKKLSSQTQPAGSGCSASVKSASYDFRGNPTSKTDFNSAITTYVYDTTRNLETRRVEASGQPTARTINTQWHPFWNLKVREAAPKLITTSVYNGQPDPTANGAVLTCAPSTALIGDQPIAVLCKRIEQATSDETGAAGFAAVVVGNAKVSSWTYNAAGQVLTATDARGAVSQNAYYADTNADHTIGDLQSTTAADGTVTRFTRYDRNGRVLTQIDPTNVTTTYAYHPRGWLSSITRTASSGEIEVAQYTYTSFGQLATATSADASRITYTYDAAHRLTDIADNLGNKIHYTLDAMGNRIGEDTQDASSTLGRRVQRTYDALNRVQQVTGAAP